MENLILELIVKDINVVIDVGLLCLLSCDLVSCCTNVVISIGGEALCLTNRNNETKPISN